MLFQFNPFIFPFGMFLDTFRGQLHKLLLLMGSCLSMLLDLIVGMFQFGDGLYVKRIYVG